MLRFSDSGNTPKVKADEDLNSSVSWEPVIPFTIKQMGPEEGACAAWRDREGPLASHIGLVRKRMAFEANTGLSQHELLNEPELGPDQG